jgi:hypothetical protein
LNAEVPKERIRKIMYFINVANECLKLGDFNGFFSVVGGLQCTPVLRLERTWTLVDRKDASLFSGLRELISPDNNSGAYRTKLSSIDSNSACIPYLGMSHLHVNFKGYSWQT